MKRVKYIKIVFSVLMVSLFYGCSSNNPTVIKPPVSFTAEQAEANRLNTARLAKIDDERAHRKKMKAVDVEIHRAKVDVLKLKAQAALEKAKPDTVIIDTSRSVHLH